MNPINPLLGYPVPPPQPYIYPPPIVSGVVPRPPEEIALMYQLSHPYIPPPYVYRPNFYYY